MNNDDCFSKLIPMRHHGSSTQTVRRKFRLLAQVAPFLRPYSGLLAAAFLALAGAAASALAMPILVRRTIDLGFLAQDVAFLDRSFFILSALVLLFAIAAATRYYLVMWLGERVIADLRSAVYRHVIRMDPAFFETTRTGEVLSRLTTDTTLVQSVVGAGLSIALRSSIMLIGSLSLLILTSPALTGLILLLLPLVVIPLILFGRKVRKLSRASQDRIADSSGLAGETLNAIQTVQAFTLEAFHSQRFADSVELAFRTARRRLRARALLTAFAVLIVFGAIMIVLRVGVQAVLEQRLSTGELSQFLLYALIVATSTAALSEIWGEVQRAAGALERLLDLLNAEPAIAAPKNALHCPSISPQAIVFAGVSFHYPSRPEQHALKNFSLTVQSGETVALVGPSGAGKSTVFQLLLRFYDPQAGCILLNGLNIAQADPQAVRRRIGIVPQEVAIFSTNALENIRYGRPVASDEEVYEAARAAAAYEFIKRLPEGFYTFLGERGIRLSGGQKQRIAIARAILKNPPILLLDEATSALDAESERLIQEALERLMAKRTTLIIAHRLSTVRKVERIAVMDQGRIVAMGTHQELVQQNGLYARLAELQLGAFNRSTARPAR